MIKLGDKVKDKVSGVTGIVVCKTVYLNGCIQYGIQTKFKKTDTDLCHFNIDEQYLIKIGNGLNVKRKPAGGLSKKTIH